MCGQEATKKLKAEFVVRDRNVISQYKDKKKFRKFQYFPNVSLSPTCISGFLKSHMLNANASRANTQTISYSLHFLHVHMVALKYNGKFTYLHYL